jgi:phage protein D
MTDFSLPSQFHLQFDETDAPEDLQRDLMEVTVENSLHLPDAATLVLHDVHLRWVDDARLMPGHTLKVFAGSRADGRPLFDGEIVELEPELMPGAIRLVVRAYDRLHRLARGRHVRSFQNLTDGDLVRKIAQEVGLQAKFGPASEVQPYLFQANQTNLALLQERARALGYFLYVEGKTLCCVPPTAEAPPIALQWGGGLQEFRPRLTTIAQVSGVTVRGWDPATRQEIIGQAKQGEGTPHIGEKRGGGEVAQSAFHIEATAFVTDRPVRTQVRADHLAKAVAGDHATRFLEAEGRCAGNPNLGAGSSVRILGIGERFGGDYLVTSAVHHYSAEQGYTVHFHVSGQRPATLLALLTPEAQNAPAEGLAIGIVTDNQDPEGQGRVKVKYPWLSSEHSSDWARVVAPGGGPGRGIQFLPEINDEVLVGFERGDILYPYVLGGLWNGQDAPPVKSGDAVHGGKVQQRVMRSRTGHTILLDDSESGGGITIQDKKGNQIFLDTASNALSLTFKGDITVTAQGGLKLEAQGAVEIKGNGVKIDGGAANVDVKGSLINLN